MRRWIDILLLRARSLFRRSAADRELARELRFHLDQRVRELVDEGLAADQARLVAAREFGSTASVEQQCREKRRVGFLSNLVQDLVYSCRVLRREPMLAIAATMSIGLGVGVNLSIFGLGNTLLLSIPTAAEPGRLVNIRTSGGSHTSFPMWRALDDSGVLAGIAGYVMETEVNWRGPVESVAINPLITTANYFDVMRVPMLMGRGFTAAEAASGRDARLAVLGHRFWTRRLAADPDIVGSSIVLNGEPFSVLGVLPAEIRSPAGLGMVPDLYLPITQALVPGLDRPASGHVQLVGRLRDGQSVDQGRAALTTIAARVAEETGAARDGRIRVFSQVGRLDQAAQGFREVAWFFIALLLVTALVLAIACANVAGLLLARATARRREIALRLALGATRRRLIQQLLTEGLVLSLLGVAAGLLLTLAVGSLASRVSLPLPLPIEFHVDFTGRMFWLAAGLVVLSAVMCGLTPALQATRAALVPALKVETRSYGHRRFTLRSLIVTGQVAISVVLLVVTLLFARNLGLASTIAPGFAADRLVVAALSFVEGRQGPAAAPAVEAMVDRVRALPGVAAAAFTAGVPLTPSGFNSTGTEMRIEGHAAPVRVGYSGNYVGPGYFAAMGIPLRHGRDFAPADRAGSPVVVVVNEEFARRYSPRPDMVGLHLDLETGRNQTVSAEVIGVVANSKYRTIGEDLTPAVYEAFLQRGSSRHAFILAATHPPMQPTADAVRAALLQMDGSAAVEVEPMTARLTFAFVPSRIGAAIMGSLGVLGALLAMVGLYGVVAFNVGRRVPEIAIRMALGASRGAVLRLMLADSAWLAGVGIAAGLALAVVATPLLSSFLVAGLSPGDPISFIVTGVVVGLTSLAAAWRPARRAVRVDPSVALRAE